MEENELVPGDQDENVGGEPPKKKREKRKKSKEERVRDRKTVFFVFLIVFLITLAFYLWPMISGLKFGNGLDIKIPEWKGYTEVEM